MRTSYLQTQFGGILINEVNSLPVRIEFTKEDYARYPLVDIYTYIQEHYHNINVDDLHGTLFQKSVWKEILKIPIGSTKTYQQIAEAVGCKRSYRAVANACGQNQLALVIPCHRVVGKHNIGGYRWGMELKMRLLDYEKNKI